MKNLQRLMSKTTLNGECVDYTGGIGSHGYGVFWMNGKSQNAHKASFLLNISDIPPGKWVLHTCDNKKCINPKHLYLGNREQNTLDAVNRNRMAKGEKHGTKTTPNSFRRCNAIFNNEQCIEIFNSKLDKKQLAKFHKVNLCTIYRAISIADALLEELNK